MRHLILVANRDFWLLIPSGDLDAVPCRLVPHRPEYYRSRVDEASRLSVIHPWPLVSHRLNLMRIVLWYTVAQVMDEGLPRVDTHADAVPVPLLAHSGEVLGIVSRYVLRISPGYAISRVSMICRRASSGVRVFRATKLKVIERS